MNEGDDLIFDVKIKKEWGFFSDNNVHLYALSIYIKFVECKNGSYLFKPIVCTNLNYLFRGLRKINISGET